MFTTPRSFSVHTRYTKNNGITKGYHNKMKIIVRKGFGFRNFENHRLRVKALAWLLEIR